jgi:hypothetical protein
MHDILDVLVAHGVPGATIVRVAQLIADAKQTERLRESARGRMRSVRERSRTHPNTREQKSALSLEVREEGLSKKGKEVRRKPTAIPLPDDWQPKGPQRDPTEADEFRDMCRSKGRTYVDHEAAFRNFQRSPYNPRNKNGGIPATVSDAERRKALDELEFYRQQNLGGQTNGKNPEARVWTDTRLGKARAGDEGQLRLAGGSTHGPEVEDREIANALSAVARNLRTG